MRRWSLLYAMLQLVWFLPSLMGSQVAKACDHYQNSVPECMVHCIYEARSLQYAPDKRYVHLNFGTGRFISNQNTGGGFYRGLFFLKDFSECIIETCDSSSLLHYVIQWRYDITCSALAHEIGSLNPYSNNAPPNPVLAVGGTPTFQIMGEDGEIMMFLSEAERAITPGADTLLVTSIIMIFFLVVAW